MIGTRVRFKGKRGTIRYVGPVVSDTSGKGREWFGIEWDEKGDGIHDGSVLDEASGQMVRYFTCDNEKGSFIKPDKASLPKSFEEAFHERYSIYHKGIVLAKDLLKENLKVVSLSGSDIGLTKWNDELDFTHIEILDLTNTLFDSWNGLLALANRIPNLKELIVSDNRGIKVKHPITPTLKFERLSTLVLNENLPTVLTEVSSLASFPNLKDLRLAKCGLTHIPDDLAETIVEIDLSYNNIHGIFDSDIEKLPKGLQVLNLSGNSEIALTITPSNVHESLAKLNLDLTGMQTLEEVENLDIAFPSLKEVRLLQTPLERKASLGDVVRSRARIIVRLPNIKVLHGTEVLQRERIDAELLCLRSGESFRRRNELAERIGFEQPAPQKQINLKAVVKFTHDGHKLVERKLPITTTLSNILLVYERLFSMTDHGNQERKLRIQVNDAEYSVLPSDRSCLSDYLPDIVPGVALPPLSITLAEY